MIYRDHDGRRFKVLGFLPGPFGGGWLTTNLDPVGAVKPGGRWWRRTLPALPAVPESPRRPAN